MYYYIFTRSLGFCSLPPLRGATSFVLAAHRSRGIGALPAVAERKEASTPGCGRAAPQHQQESGESLVSAVFTTRWPYFWKSIKLDRRERLGEMLTKWELAEANSRQQLKIFRPSELGWTQLTTGETSTRYCWLFSTKLYLLLFVCMCVMVCFIELVGEVKTCCSPCVCVCVWWALTAALCRCLSDDDRLTLSWFQVWAAVWSPVGHPARSTANVNVWDNNTAPSQIRARNLRLPDKRVNLPEKPFYRCGPSGVNVSGKMSTTTCSNGASCRFGSGENVAHFNYSFSVIFVIFSFGRLTSKQVNRNSY